MRNGLKKERHTSMEISARNVLQGVVKSIVHGAVNSEVTIEVTGEVEIVSIITKDSVEKLNLSQGKKVYAVVKASDVMVAID